MQIEKKDHSINLDEKEEDNIIKYESSISLKTANEIYKIQNDDKNDITLKDVFDQLDHLNKYDLEISENFYYHQNKELYSGSFSTSFLGEDINTGVKVIILRTELTNKDQINIEEYILQKIHGLGNLSTIFLIPRFSLNIMKHTS